MPGMPGRHVCEYKAKSTLEDFAIGKPAKAKPVAKAKRLAKAKRAAKPQPAKPKRAARSAA